MNYMRRPGNYYCIILLNKNKNVQVMLLVRFFVHKKYNFNTLFIYRDSNTKEGSTHREINVGRGRLIPFSFKSLSIRI